MTSIESAALAGTHGPPLDPLDLAVVLLILDKRGPSTHAEIAHAYSSLLRHPRLTPEWVSSVTRHLVGGGYVEADPVAGRGERGRKARRWRIARPLTDSHLNPVPPIGAT